MHDMQMSIDEMKHRAKVHFIRDIADQGRCSIWGCGYRDQKLLETLDAERIELYHIYDSDQKK